MVISHLKREQDKWVIQDNADHQQGVAERCSRFADAFGMSEWGRVLGLLHDTGKELPAFQQYIKRESGYDPQALVSGPHQHAYVGGLVAKQLFPAQSALFGNAIMGHHRGLYDTDEFIAKLGEQIPKGISLPKLQANLTLPSAWAGLKPYDLHAVQRMLFSCLVDADYLDTEAFMQPEQAALRGSKSTLDQLLQKLEEHLAALKSKNIDSVVNRVRDDVQQQCRARSEGEAGFYSLTVPTGGGKTLSALMWALKHAVHNRLQRIIIAIPYTSIITQTAATLKSIFGEENVLEHHSEFDDESIDGDELKQTMKLASENWDYPVIVTTNVQLFESLFSNRTSRCRKLHNIVKSVILLDEVQTLPMTHLQPIVQSLDTMHRVFGCSVLFTTASQPILSGEIVGSNPLVRFEGLPRITEIISPDSVLHDKLRRVELTFDETPRTYDEIAAEITKHNRILCVVNTRRDAKELFDRLPDEGLTIHLSRMMYPLHVKRAIEQIKSALANPSQKIIRVVSTQLIEAGVDIDFPVVFRQEAGLDSVLQAAGRCNREGRLEGLGHAWVFSLQGSNQMPLGAIRQANDSRKSMQPNQDWFAPAAMTEFFRQLYSRTRNFDKPQIEQLLYNTRPQFEEASKEFQLIDDATTPIIVNCAESAPLIEKLKCAGPSFGLMKQLRQYCVNIRRRDFDKLCQYGAISRVREGLEVFTLLPKLYKEKTGLCTENEWLEESLII